MWTKSERPQKDDARNYALLGLSYKKSSLWLPGQECMCIDYARNNNIVGYNSRLILVEKDYRYLPNIERWVANYDYRNSPILHADELCNLELPNKLDYAFLDFLGSFERRITVWMNDHLAKNLLPNAELAVTHSYGWRQNKFMYEAQDALSRLEIYNEFRQNIRIFDVNLTVPMALMKCMFRQWNFEFRWPFKYKDSYRSMILFRLENFQPVKDNGWPSIRSLVTSLDRNMIMCAKKKVLTAAEKAWVTRRAAAKTKVHKASEAAHKAWATRRAKAVIKPLMQSSKGTAAAHKAWATRRANAIG